jgi:hypothetical protein
MLPEREFIALFDEVDAVIGVSPASFAQELCETYRDRWERTRLRSSSS